MPARCRSRGRLEKPKPRWPRTKKKKGGGEHDERKEEERIHIVKFEDYSKNFINLCAIF